MCPHDQVLLLLLYNLKLELDCSTLHTRSYWLSFSFLTMWPWFWHRQTLTRYKTHNNQKFYADTQLMFWYSNNWLFNLATICIVFYILIPQSSGKCQGDPDSNKAESNLIYWVTRYNNVNIYAVCAYDIFCTNMIKNKPKMAYSRSLPKMAV